MGKAKDFVNQLGEDLHPVQQSIIDTALKRLDKVIEDLSNLNKVHNVGGQSNLDEGPILILQKDLRKIKDRISGLVSLKK